MKNIYINVFVLEWVINSLSLSLSLSAVGVSFQQVFYLQEEVFNKDRVRGT